INVENRAGLLFEEALSYSNNKWRIRNWCQRPSKQLSILPTGDVVLCCAVWKGEVVLGNVKQQTLYEIWHGETINYYRDKLKKGDLKDLSPCNNCMQADIVIDEDEIVEFKKYIELGG